MALRLTLNSCTYVRIEVDLGPVFDPVSIFALRFELQQNKATTPHALQPSPPAGSEFQQLDEQNQHIHTTRTFSSIGEDDPLTLFSYQRAQKHKTFRILRCLVRKFSRTGNAKIERPKKTKDIEPTKEKSIASGRITKPESIVVETQSWQKQHIF